MQNILDVCPFSLAVPCCYPPLVNYYIVINISPARSIFSVGLTLRSNCPPWVRYIANVRHSDQIPGQIPNFTVTQRIWFIRFTWLLSVTRLLNDYTNCLTHSTRSPYQTNSSSSTSPNGTALPDWPNIPWLARPTRLIKFSWLIPNLPVTEGIWVIRFKWFLWANRLLRDLSIPDFDLLRF